ncbi:MAG: M1 family metallopeptidase [Rhodanobacteraceae bacterium]|nr:M1 family metallopeptidase [Rhodanobacteraceae bacterium]
MNRVLSWIVFAILLSGCAGSAKRDQPSLLTMASGAPRTSEQSATRIDAVVLRLRVDPKHRRIAGDVTLNLQTRSALAAIDLDLDRRYAISSIEVDGGALEPARWRNPEGRLHIELPKPTLVDVPFAIRIRYSGAPRVAEHAPWDGGFVWSKTPSGADWIATAVQGEGCDLFWPCIDHPTAEPAVVEQFISVPAPLVVAGNGIDLGMTEQVVLRTYHWRTEHPNTYAIALNIAPYAHLEGEYRSRYGNTIPLHFWYLPEREDGARKLFAEFPRMLDFFERMIGPYPFGNEKMGVSETPHLGMEHQTINAYGNEYKLDEYGFDWLLQHEFAHEWFGNQLTNADWDDMWLHEGFGAYMQPLYTQWLHGDMAYLARLFEQRKTLRNQFPIVSGRSQCEHIVYHPEHGPGGDIYVKGSLVLHTLRAMIGDAAFFDATRRLVYGTPTPKPGEFAPRIASTRDFIADVNAASGRDLQWFFDVYLFQAALPELVIARDDNGMSLRWKVMADKPFPMPVEVRVNDTLQVLDLVTGSARIAVTRDDIVIVDPSSKLLRALPHLEAWQKTLEGKKPRRVTPIDPADPCLLPENSDSA